MIPIIRAPYALCTEVQAIINSNASMYKDIVQNPADWRDHYITEEWCAQNFAIREFYLARLEGQYVGVGTYQSFADFGYIGFLYIRSGWQRKGIGTALLQFLQLRTLQDQHTQLRLFCNPRATWAIRMYQARGFTIEATDFATICVVTADYLRAFYEDGSILLHKHLATPLVSLSPMLDVPEE